jgi:hypothetical protein
VKVDRQHAGGCQVEETRRKQAHYAALVSEGVDCPEQLRHCSHAGPQSCGRQPQLPRLRGVSRVPFLPFTYIHPAIHPPASTHTITAFCPHDLSCQPDRDGPRPAVRPPLIRSSRPRPFSAVPYVPHRVFPLNGQFPPIPTHRHQPGPYVLSGVGSRGPPPSSHPASIRPWARTPTPPLQSWV